MPWTTDDSADLYQVAGWGAGYVAVGADGGLKVRPRRDESAVDLPALLEALAKQGIRTPVMIRFTDILADRLQCLHDAFTAAIEAERYDGEYIAVYPIKVNQQRPVVEELYRRGREFGFGLEVGSKPELLAALAVAAGDPGDRPIICNGFKDSPYLETAVLAAKLGRPVVPVIESMDELELLLRHADTHGVRPDIGVRLKIATRGGGRWAGSTGVRSKFGLYVSEVLDAVAQLRDRDMLDCLRLVHCHAGSQMQDIERIKRVVDEIARVYTGLAEMGAGVRYLDVGGGLGVDYDGSHTNDEASMNYSLTEYATGVVQRVRDVCAEQGVAAPTLITESGRAVAAYHTLLVFDVLGAEVRDQFEAPAPIADDAELPQPLVDLHASYREASPPRLVDCYQQAISARRRAVELFRGGEMSLAARGETERLFWAALTRVRDLAADIERPPEELAPLESLLADTYFCNLSIFQSLPDIWALGQLFPIMPIHRLDERPTRRAVLADLTCDSDGKIDRFTDVEDVRRALPVHALREDERYFLAAFLVGAYQETLGDLHNLFGDTHVVHVRLTDDDGGWEIETVIEGDRSREVLGYVQYDADDLADRLGAECQRAVEEGRLTAQEGEVLLSLYRAELDSYTYLTEV